MFERAIARYNIDPAASVMFGDKPGDIEAARKVGIKGFLVDPNENIEGYCKRIISGNVS